MLRIALPNKGRLVEDLKTLFADAGLPLRGTTERALRAQINEDIEALFVRAQDIPELVSDGAADLGVTGSDLVAESGRSLHELRDLEFGRCRLVVATREDAGAEIRSGTRVATVFPRIAREYFEKKGLAVTIVPVSGAAEIAPHLGIADVIVDLTSTGSTLKQNGLREVATVLESSARLYSREAPNAQVQELTLAIDSVLRARGQRYLMANVPKSALAAVHEALPGLEGPTMMPIHGSELSAMHAVVPEKQVYRIVAQLKALGCSGILVTRIERLVP